MYIFGVILPSSSLYPLLTPSRFSRSRQPTTNVCLPPHVLILQTNKIRNKKQAHHVPYPAKCSPHPPGKIARLPSWSCPEMANCQLHSQYAFTSAGPSALVVRRTWRFQKNGLAHFLHDGQTVCMCFILGVVARAEGESERGRESEREQQTRRKR